MHSPFPASGAKGIVFWSGDEAAAKGYARRRTENGLPTFVLDDTLYGRMLVRVLSRCRHDAESTTSGAAVVDDLPARGPCRG